MSEFWANLTWPQAFLGVAVIILIGFVMWLWEKD